MKKLGFLFLMAIPVFLNAQTDDFNDTNDVGWVRYDPLGSHPQLPDIATYSFPNGGYRIQTVPSPNPAFGPGRAGALRTDATYTDFYISVDIINWDDTVNQAFGIIARVTQVGLGATDGYAMTWDRGGRDIDISVFTNEAPVGIRTIVNNDQAPLVPGRSYRMTFAGKGNQLTGEMFELPNLDTPIATIIGEDDAWPSGVAGLLVYDNTSARTGTTDATFDNYFANSFRPPRLKIEALPFQEYLLSWPAEPTNYVLQYTTTLGVNWADITTDILEGGGRRSYYDTSQEEKRYYRLRP